MSKKLVISLVLIMLFIYAAVNVAAVEPTVYTEGDWQYILLSEGNARITGYTGEEKPEITVPGTLNGHTVTEMGGLQQHEGVFTYSDTLARVTLPDSMKEIGRYSFYSCWVLEEINMPNNLEVIGPSAFYSCHKLPNIILPNTVRSIEFGAFARCSSFTEFTVPPLVTEIPERLISFCTAIEIVTLPDGLLSIGDYAFDGCSSLVEIALPNSVTEVGREVFYNCHSLEKVTLSNNLTAISGSMFANCIGLKEVVVPGSVKTIHNGAFRRCSSLESVTLQEGLEIIEAEAFSPCLKLREIAIPNSVKNISQRVFKDCVLLSNVTLPTGLETIDSEAFSNCSALESIVFPNSLKTIYYKAFSSTGLTSVNIPAGCELYAGVFETCRSLTQVTLQPGFSTLGNGCFQGCSMLSEITIPGSVKIIPETAFAATGLVRVTLEDGVTTIRSNAFAGCRYLHMIYIPRSITEIAAGGTELGPGPFSLSTMTVIYGFKDSSAHQFFYDNYFYVPFIDLETGARDPIPTLIITASGNGTIQYLGSIVLTANLRDVTWSGGNSSLRITPDGKTCKVESVKNFLKSGSADIIASTGDQSETFSVKVKPSVWQWIFTIVFFGWIWY